MRYSRIALKILKVRFYSQIINQIFHVKVRFYSQIINQIFHVRSRWRAIENSLLVSYSLLFN